LGCAWNWLSRKRVPQTIQHWRNWSHHVLNGVSLSGKTTTPFVDLLHLLAGHCREVLPSTTRQGLVCHSSGDWDCIILTVIGDIILSQSLGEIGAFKILGWRQNTVARAWAHAFHVFSWS
jgi:hypothetical protein